MKKEINSLPTRKGQWVLEEGNNLIENRGDKTRIRKTTNKPKAELNQTWTLGKSYIQKQIAYFKMQMNGFMFTYSTPCCSPCYRNQFLLQKLPDLSCYGLIRKPPPSTTAFMRLTHHRSLLSLLMLSFRNHWFGRAQKPSPQKELTFISTHGHTPKPQSLLHLFLYLHPEYVLYRPLKSDPLPTKI